MVGVYLGCDDGDCGGYYDDYGDYLILLQHCWKRLKIYRWDKAGLPSCEISCLN